MLSHASMYGIQREKNKAINNHMIMKPEPWITKLRLPSNGRKDEGVGSKVH